MWENIGTYWIYIHIHSQMTWIFDKSFDYCFVFSALDASELKVTSLSLDWLTKLKWMFL